MPKTLAEITAAVEGNPRLRKSLGRERLWEACASCSMAGCNPTVAGCRARQLLAQRRAAHYRANREECCAAQRAYYHAHRGHISSQRSAYAKDPVVRALRNAKRRASQTEAQRQRRRAADRARYRAMTPEQLEQLRHMWRERARLRAARLRATQLPTGDNPA